MASRPGDFKSPASAGSATRPAAILAEGALAGALPFDMEAGRGKMPSRMVARPIEMSEVVRGIRRKDPRFAPEAYEFVLQALEHTYRKVGERRHVSARELLEGIRDHANQRFGTLALLVLGHWGVRTTADFGAIVFHLVGAGVMGKTDSDSPQDFDAVYDFHEAFGATEPLKVEWGDEG